MSIWPSKRLMRAIGERLTTLIRVFIMGLIFSPVVMAELSNGSLEELIKRANEGDVQAQTYLGALYVKGQGIPQSYASAATWYAKAAQAGDTYAQNNLGDLYQYGLGVSQSHVTAAAWYEKAVRSGNAVAQANLSRLYRDGKGVLQDYDLARTLYEKAAISGDANAISKLSELYHNGQALPQHYLMPIAIKPQEKSYSDPYKGLQADEVSSLVFLALRNKDAVSQYRIGNHFFCENCNVEPYLYIRNKIETGSFVFGSLRKLPAHFQTQGIESNFEMSVQSYLFAAAQGNPIAQYMAGLQIYFGIGTLKDEKRGFELLLNSAQAGMPDAQYVVGNINRFGLPMSVDKRRSKEALYWYKKAAANGLSQSIYAIGEIYSMGSRGYMQSADEIIVPDREKAIEYYFEAAKLKNPTAIHWLAYLYSNGVSENKKNILNKDAATSFLYFEMAANLGNWAACYSLADRYLRGWEVEVNLKKAEDYFFCAAKEGNELSFRPLADLLFARKAYAESAIWYVNAADGGDIQAQSNLGFLFLNGQGVPQSDTVAAGWFEKAATKGDANAQNGLGWLYENGRGVPKNFSTAASWFEKSANSGHSVAQYNLGLLYENGWGVGKDLGLARHWYQQSAAQGYTLAKNALSQIATTGSGADTKTSSSDRSDGAVLALGAAILGAIILGSNSSDKKEESSSSGKAKIEEKEAGNSSCRKKAVEERIASCLVKLDYCELTGCKYAASCSGQWDTGSCESILERETTGGNWYCDIETKGGYSHDKEDVIQAICSE